MENQDNGAANPRDGIRVEQHPLPTKGIDQDRKEAQLNLGKKEKKLVGRRAPINPLEKIKILKGLKTGNYKDAVLSKDPMLENNPISGRLWVTFIVNSAIFFVFLSELVFNKVTFNGRCISKALYPRVDKNPRNNPTPYIVELGYGACEYNLRANAFNSVFFGNGAADKGWPKDLVVTPSHVYAGGDASWHSPDQRIYSLFGGLDTNMMRNYNETFRLFWAMFMHGNWYHITFNLFCQVQALWIIEPDWGFLRTLSLYFVGGIGGNLISAALDPCGTTVGSSGAMYGLYGAMVPYCIEYWNTIPRPVFLLCYNIVTLIIGLILGLNSQIDNYAHLGGCIFGMLWGFATIKSVSSCDKCTLMERAILCPLWSWAIPAQLKAKLNLVITFKKSRGDQKRELFEAKKRALASGMSESRVATIKKRFQRDGAPPCRMRLREWFIRLTAAFTLVLLTTVFALFVFNPDVYSKFSPPGQYKFSGWQTCSCCFVKNINKLFKNSDTPERYNGSQMFWCFSSIKHAEVYCGNDYQNSRDTLGLLALSHDTAKNIIGNA